MIGSCLSMVRRTASPSHQSNGRMHLTKKQGDYSMLTKFCKGFAMGCVHILFILFLTKGLIIVNCSLHLLHLSRVWKPAYGLKSGLSYWTCMDFLSHWNIFCFLVVESLSHPICFVLQLRIGKHTEGKGGRKTCEKVII